ncbi:MAG: hypothetical protein ACE5JR_00770 [Gemmatimonadota bacterium]
MSREAGEPAARGVDPWGLRRIEKLLVGLDGVSSLKIVPDGHGGIDEIHVLSVADLSAKQIVRNIESALLAEFGLQIDHRKISVARLKGPEIPVVSEAEAEAETQAGARRFLLDGFHIERKTGQQVSCRVQLRSGDTEYVGEAEGPDYAKSRLEVACDAVLQAIQKATGDKTSLSLEGVSQIDALGRRLLAVVVHDHARRTTVCLAGIGRVQDSPEEAAVLACLHATNRWIANK